MKTQWRMLRMLRGSTSKQGGGNGGDIICNWYWWQPWQLR